LTDQSVASPICEDPLSFALDARSGRPGGAGAHDLAHRGAQDGGAQANRARRAARHRLDHRGRV